MILVLFCTVEGVRWKVRESVA